MKNTLNNVTKLSLAALTLAATGCTESLQVLFKPSAELDPIPMHYVPPSSPNVDPLFEKQWNLRNIGIDSTMTSSGALRGNASVTVAILSTGIDYNHEDLVGRVVPNEGELMCTLPGSTLCANGKDDDQNGLVDDIVGYDVVANDGFAFDRHGAGTAVAGIIAARPNNGKGMMGIVENVTLYPVRYINDNGETSVYNLIRALEVVTLIKPKVVFIQSTQVRLGGTEGSAAVRDVELASIAKHLDKIRAMRIPVIIGAGNNNTLFGAKPVENFFRKYENVIVVTSSDESDKRSPLANFSSQYVTTAAPGAAVFTTKLSNSYGPVTSTAAAAAHITAAYALLAAKYGSVNIAQARDILASERGGDVLPGVADISLGRNRFNLAKFLNAMQF